MRTPSLPFLVLVLWLLVTSVPHALAQEANLNRASVKPTAVIPFMPKAPVIDGVIGDGEWNTLHVSKFVGQGTDQLQQRPGEFWVGCDRKRLYIAVRSGVHPTVGAVTKLKEAVGTKDEQGTVFDDSIELFFHNAPQGGAGEYYQVLVNSAGVLYDQEFDAIEKIGRTYWRAAMEQAHKVEKSVWTAEFAIDLASIKVKSPTQLLAMRVCRNFKYDWNQSRWAPRVIAFDAPETMPLVRFAEAAPVVSEVGFQDEKGICVAMDVGNPGTKPLPVTVKLGYNAESQPRYYQETPAELKPGETKRFEYRKEFFTGDNYPALAEVLITGAGGAVLYHRDVKWQTKPKGTGWAAMGDAPPEEAVQFGFEFHPTPRAARWQVEFAGMKGREAIKAVRLEIAPKDGGPAVYTATAAPNATFTVPVRVETIKNLKDGLYEASLFLDGATPAAKPVKTALFGLRSDFPWLNNTIGKDDIVIPPFTPMEVSGKTIKTILRAHTLADNGLWAQVTAEGRPLLAAPMRIEVVRGGKTEVAKGTAKLGATKPTAVEAGSDWQTAAVTGRTRMAMEYDGCAKVTLTLAPTDDQPVDALRLVIPLADKEMPLMHAVGDGIRFNYAGKVPGGEGKIWGSDKASRSQLLGTFLPYLWVGGESRGLCWFAGNDRDWILDPKEQTPALELRRAGKTLELVVNLVQVPVPLGRERTIVFGLQATPTRPMPANWRQMGVASGVPEDYQILGMSMYWGADLYNVAPRGGDYEVVRKIAARGRGEGRDNAFFEAYFAKNPDKRAEVAWSANGGKVAGIIPYTNLRGDNDRNPEWFVYQDEWRNAAFSDRTPPGGHSGPVDFCVALPPSRVDFLLYHYQKLIESGLAAIYWDNIYIAPNANPVSGTAYGRAHGGMQPEADIWRVREVTKRTAVMLHQMGKPNVSVPHMTNALLIPAFSWTGINLDWEWKYGNTDYQDRFTRDYIRACSLGLTHGGVPMILDGTKDTRTTAETDWVNRTQIAACVPHEIKVWQVPGLYGRLLKAMVAMGYGTPECAVHHYWDEKPVATVKGIDGIFLTLAGKDKVMLVVSDYGNGGTAKVTLDPKRLGLPADFTAVNWEHPEDTVTAVNGTVTLPNFRKHDFRVLLINKAGK
jgi:hypothetical protein